MKANAVRIQYPQHTQLGGGCAQLAGAANKWKYFTSVYDWASTDAWNRRLSRKRYKIGPWLLWNA